MRYPCVAAWLFSCLRFFTFPIYSSHCWLINLFNILMSFYSQKPLMAPQYLLLKFKLFLCFDKLSPWPGLLPAFSTFSPSTHLYILRLGSILCCQWSFPVYALCFPTFLSWLTPSLAWIPLSLSSLSSSAARCYPNPTLRSSSNLISPQKFP